MKKIKNKMTALDQEEIDLEKALTFVELSDLSLPDKSEQKKFKESASTFFKKETKMNIRISSIELDEIKKRAKSEGLRYQTFVKSILHKYMTGQLCDTPVVN